ncbi:MULTISPECIES: cytochrome ubiquinol oxidase subunit I [Paenibacillus]|uniref:Cytochrome ubiquinol oxidase subunit I n=1 Tax=Paenibacillus residui TaxID=629724 RepID=A0ABW3DCX1_9BACL|nr:MULTISPECIES: cytochrome ubiquinol oxidase subunit I [Paenibacillaceae]
MFANDPALYSRILTALTLGFHIIFATVGVGVPLMIALAEWTGIRRKDPHYILLARRWARGFVITVAIGVVTGTAIGLQLSLLWPSFMQVAGQVISLPLFMETFAFFFEAIFLGIYLYTWDRFKSRFTHFLLVIPVVIGSSASAFFITTVNSFMNTPQGFTLQDNKLVDIQPLAAMFNPATPTKVSHVLSSAYMTSAFILAAIAAFSLLKKRDHVYYKKALNLTMTAAFIFSISTAVIGDFSGKFLAKYQPEKLAAAEWHFETIEKAPLILGGILTEDNQVKYAIEIPYALSILAHGMPNTEVIGLNDFPEDERPPLYIHYLFDGMVMIGVFLALISCVYMVLQYKKSWNPHRRTLLRLIVASGPLAILAIEFGWIFAEVGRQPWILRGYMKTVEGATTSEHVGTMLILFSLLYLVLAITCIKVLRKLFRNHPAEKELEEGAAEGGYLQ